MDHRRQDQVADRDVADLDWAICQLQREHARVFQTIAGLRAAATRIRTGAAR